MIEKSRFEHIGANALESEEITRPSTSFFKDAMNRLFRNPVAVLCMVILSIIILMSIIVPFVSPYGMEDIFITSANAGLGHVDPVNGNVAIFGTDTLGRDLFVRVWEGGRTSLTIAFAAVGINIVVGLVYGGISGYFGGWVDNVMMRIVEIISGIPYLLIVILLSMVLPKGMISLIIAYAVVGWTGMARLVRGQIVSLKEQEFVIAAKTMGASSPRIIAKHLIPNTFSVVIVSMTLSIPSAIFTEAFLSFLGMGVPIPQASWGTLANDGIQVFQQYPHQLLVPALLISLTMLAFNLLGDALRDALDPKLRR